MILLILAFVGFAVSTINQEAINNATNQWMQSKEELFTMLSIGPLKEEVNPQFIGRRKYKDVLTSQTDRFRSKVARSLVETIGDKATTCIDPTMTSDDAVQIVHDELVKRGFTIVWAKSSTLCPTIGGRGASALIVDLPPAQKEQQK